jgi:hypothetical protein
MLGIVVCFRATSDAETPVEDAAYLWHMAAPSNAAGAAGGLKAHGAVTFGALLGTPEREASIARGGDGKAARFEGGYLALAHDGELKVNPREWTVAIRMRDPEGTWRYPILGSYGSDKQVSFALHAVDGSKKPFTDRSRGGGGLPTVYSWMFKPAGPRPLAWYDFTDGKSGDRSGNFPDGRLYGNVRVENGELVLDRGDYFKAPGTLNTQVRLTSSDLDHWTQVEGPFITSDKRLNICPNVFQFGQWHYYICGSGVWRSRGAFGPWTEHEPLRLDNLAVPKTAEFGKDRRIYAGFLPDGGWGGNSVLRELVQDDDGRLGTRFVPELIPECGKTLPISFEPESVGTTEANDAIRLEAKGAVQVVTIPKIANDYRLELDVVPERGTASFGIGLRAGSGQADDGCELIFQPTQKRVRFSKMSNSGGGIGGGPAIEGVTGLDKPFSVDIIVRHDIADAEIAGFRTLTTRFWNPDGDRIRLSAQNGSVTFRNMRIRPLTESYAPYPRTSE